VTITPTPTATATPTGTISFVGASAIADYNSPVTAVDIGVPANVQAGDILLAQIVVWDCCASDVPTPPSGWTSIRHDAFSNQNRITSWLYYKAAGANEPASYVFSLSSNWTAGVMGAWRGASPSPIDNTSGAAAGGPSPVSDAAPSLTPANSNELQVYFYGSQASVGPTIALPAAIAPRFDMVSSKEGFTLGFGDLAAPQAGTASATYPATATLGGTFPVLTAQAVLLIPAPQFARSTPTTTVTATPMPTVAAPLTVSPSTATFTAKLGKKSKVKSITAANQGRVAITLFGARVTGDFQLSRRCGGALMPNKRCAYGVVFAPTGKGTRSGELTIDNNGSSGPRTVNLSGTGE
jgi:hypothetical protein